MNAVLMEHMLPFVRELGMPLYHGTTRRFDERTEPLLPKKGRPGSWLATNWDESAFYAGMGLVEDGAERRVIEYAPTRALRIACFLTDADAAFFSVAFRSNHIASTKCVMVEAGLDGYAYPSASEDDPRYGGIEACHVVLFDAASTLCHAVTHPHDAVPEHLQASIPAF